MNKKLTYLLALTFLFLFSGSVYGQETEVKRKYHDNGQLWSEVHFKDGFREGLLTTWYESGRKESKIHYKNGKKETRPVEVEKYGWVPITKGRFVVTDVCNKEYISNQLIPLFIDKTII